MVIYIYINSNCVMETTSLILLDHTNMQDVKDDEETDPAATQLSSSMKHLSLSPFKQQEAQRISDELSDSSLYSGVGIVCDY